jgi:hypothetical protein
MNWQVKTYIAYLVISVGLTIWVARTLHKNGRIFLVDTFIGNERLADSVNHLLVVGFYLINIGYVMLALRFGTRATDLQEMLESLSTRVGAVLLLLGIMHFGNILGFSAMRKRAMHKAPPPIPPRVPHVPTTLAHGPLPPGAGHM